MVQITLSEDIREQLLDFLKKSKKPDLMVTYIYFLEKKFDLHPVLFPREKKIYQSLKNLIGSLEENGMLWHETEIRIQFGQESVNEDTKKIYICPYTGKVFGDNTNPNPQDAIYDWVSRCPENKDRIGGLKAKRFFVSEDPEIIKKYITKDKNTITKKVFSSVITGKLFNSKKAIIDDFTQNHVKPMTLFEVQNQNRFQIEGHFLKFIQEQLTEAKISAFIETLAEYEEFKTYVAMWTE